jgi:hypothetical protein
MHNVTRALLSINTALLIPVRVPPGRYCAAKKYTALYTTETMVTRVRCNHLDLGTVILHFWLTITKGRTTMIWTPNRQEFSSNTGTLPERTSTEAILIQSPNREPTRSTYASKTLANVLVIL